MNPVAVNLWASDVRSRFDETSRLPSSLRFPEYVKFHRQKSAQHDRRQNQRLRKERVNPQTNYRTKRNRVNPVNQHVSKNESGKVFSAGLAENHSTRCQIVENHPYRERNQQRQFRRESSKYS